MGEYSKRKATRPVRLRYVNWGSKERQQHTKGKGALWLATAHRRRGGAGAYRAARSRTGWRRDESRPRRGNVDVVDWGRRRCEELQRAASLAAAGSPPPLLLLLISFFFSSPCPSSASLLSLAAAAGKGKIPQARVPVAAKAGFIGGAARVESSWRARTPRVWIGRACRGWDVWRHPELAW